MIRKRQTEQSRQSSEDFDYDNDEDVQYDMHRKSHKTSISDKIMMETSLLQTKCMYPISLGINNEDDEK